MRQQYLDVLDREAEQEGLDYWSAQLRACGADLNCVNTRRIVVSAAFFIEQEFQLTGSFIYDAYSGTLGRKPAFAEYSSDRPSVVGGANLDARRPCLLRTFVQRSEFSTKYQANTTAASFVDALIQKYSDFRSRFDRRRANLINAYNAAAIV